MGLCPLLSRAQMLVDIALKLISRNWARLALLHPPLHRGPERKAGHVVGIANREGKLPW